MGQGLRNLLAKELSVEMLEDAKKSISTAYVVLTMISSIILLVTICLVFSLNWYNIFSTEIDMRMPLAISFVYICLNFVLALSNTLLYALQLSEQIALRNCMVQVLNIVGLLVLNRLTDGSLVWLSILFGSTTMIIYIGNTIRIFQKYKFLKPSAFCFTMSKIPEICNVGIKFFIIQLACIGLFTRG